MSEQDQSKREGIFAGDDPFAIARAWLDEARETEPSDPDAAALASVDADGMPNVRVVLMRRIETDSFVFFTNYESAKGEEILGQGVAAFVIHWKSLRRQIRVRGHAEKEDGAVADAYFDGRGLISRHGAWASRQSRPLASREVLLDRLESVAETYGETPPRPPHWGGIRIRPVEIEFWADGEHRLHDRFRWTRGEEKSGWRVQRLHP